MKSAVGNMNFPKFTREENLNNKLSDEQINNIPLLIKREYSLLSIAKMFNVSKTAIWYWTLTNKKRRLINSKRYKVSISKLSYAIKEQIKESIKKSQKRKFLLKTDDIRKYKKEKMKKFLKDNPNYMTEKSKRFRARMKIENPNYWKKYYKK